MAAIIGIVCGLLLLVLLFGYCAAETSKRADNQALRTFGPRK